MTSSWGQSYLALNCDFCILSLTWLTFHGKLCGKYLLIIWRGWLLKYLFIQVRWLQCQWSRTKCTTMSNITEQVLILQTFDTLIIRDSNTRVWWWWHHAWWVFSHLSVFFPPHLANMCNTFTVHHKANRLVTQRHIVKTDVWLSWALRGVFSLISYQFNTSKSREVIKVTPKSGLCPSL